MHKTFETAADAGAWVTTLDDSAVWLVARFRSGDAWTGELHGFSSTQSHRSEVYAFGKRLLGDQSRKRNTTADALGKAFADKRYVWGDDINARHAEEHLIMSFEDISDAKADTLVVLVSKSPCASADRRKSAVLTVDGHAYPESCTAKLKEAAQIYDSVRWNVFYAEAYGNLKDVKKRGWATLTEQLGTPDGLDIRRTEQTVAQLFA